VIAAAAHTTERALFHSPLSFIRSDEAHLAGQVLAGLNKALEAGQIVAHGDKARLYLRYLAWDSDYFGCPTYRLDFADWDEGLADAPAALAAVVQIIRAELREKHGKYYLFSDVPAEDIAVMQALGLAGLRLVETKLTYFHDDLANFSWPERFATRHATVEDIPDLKRVAMDTRNYFDRYHADPFYTLAGADKYIGTYLENSVKGFADFVTVPALDPPGAFFTCDLIPPEKSALGKTLGHIALVAVEPARRGWHLKLMVEVSYQFAAAGVAVAYMSTQATNRAVIRNCEKLGYRYGRASHIIAVYE
jgi:dTDP-4-amino-4,6-dideoxy-D-galactose acyltransferase